MNEFELIAAVRAVLGPRGAHPSWEVGPGDDAAVVPVAAGHVLVSSIDTLVAGVHFPVHAEASLVGYRAMMVSLSDLAAMGAQPSFVLIALTLSAHAEDWALQFAQGVREAAEVCDVSIAGGNFARGPLSVTMSVHGTVPAHGAVLRVGAGAGDFVYVTGPLGGAAAAVRSGMLNDNNHARNTCVQRYYRPRARFDVVPALRASATAAIDVSDGLLQDLMHVGRASGVGFELESQNIPLCEGASLDDALHGGDDYELCFTSKAEHLSWATRIGTVTATSGVRLDGAAAHTRGYQHFV